MLEDLDFADDICLLAHTRTDMEIKLRRLEKNASQVGLKINVGKTKLLRLNTNTLREFSIEGELIDKVEKFCYFGSFISNNGGAETDVLSRINKARQTFSMLNRIWKASNISRNLILKIFKTNCLTVLLYGCETWKLTSTIIRKIQVFVNKYLNRIVKIYWPNTIRNEDL